MFADLRHRLTIGGKFARNQHMSRVHEFAMMTNVKLLHGLSDFWLRRRPFLHNLEIVFVFVS
jgi:hypothetical protein